MFRHQLGALALFAALAVPLAASAQTAPAPAPIPPAAAPVTQRHHHHHHRNYYLHAMRGLHLSDAQRQQIAGIMKSARGQNKAADPQTRRANMLALHQQIESVLTDAQRTQLHARLAARRQHFAKRNAPQTPPQ